MGQQLVSNIALINTEREFTNSVVNNDIDPRGGVLPYMGLIGMCRCEGYGFQAVYSSIGYI